MNSQIVIENRKAESYTPQRQVYAHVTYVGVIMEVDITKSLILSMFKVLVRSISLIRVESDQRL